ncbi:hypothetical protein QJS04_geneDACA015256 [Acorus gramineus]|uniref:Plantacyanin n=1 Tax=Acorus gramineus TaxID=55184 RepID=A0AAV9AQM8_ACOGR|nr:hypothetical protein QJS04_geneDACA015256 [Acorus gramineus]
MAMFCKAPSIQPTENKLNKPVTCKSFFYKCCNSVQTSITIPKRKKKGKKEKKKTPQLEMAMGRGSCNVPLFLMLLVLCSSSIAAVAKKTHVVGDSQGWGFSVSYSEWANGRPFSAGDVLLFNYASGVHNVVSVGPAGYRGCKGPVNPSGASSSGNDRFTLKKGPNYFICSVPGHCDAGMKIQINAD